MNPRSETNFWGSFGPGLLFAGTAIGLSHLVQSTRAGALYGLGLAGVIVLIHVLKYPMFRFGAYYAATAGESLVAGYRRQGRFALWLLLAVIAAYMFFALGAVGLLSAALIQTVLGLDMNTTGFGAAILGAAAVFLMLGRYHWLDRVNKLLVAVLAVSTLAATAVALPELEWAWWPPDAPPPDLKLMLFIAALGGFMPVSADCSVWQSLWTIAKAEDRGSKPQLRHVLPDFNIGYWGSAFFALCFLIMGAAVMNRAGIEPAKDAAPFAAQILGLYESGLGPWAKPLVGASVISVMLTTTLAGLDALPRVLAALTAALRDRAEDSGAGPRLGAAATYRLYVLLLAAGATAALYLLVDSFRAFLDFGTTVAFLATPVIALFNHRAVFGPGVAGPLQPGRGMRLWSIIGVVVLSLFTLCYLYLRLAGYLD